MTKRHIKMTLSALLMSMFSEANTNQMTVISEGKEYTRTLTANTVEQTRLEATGGGIILNYPKPSQDPIVKPSKIELIQKAVKDLKDTENKIALIMGNNQKLIKSQRAFGLKMTQFRQYFDSYLSASATCQVAEDKYKLKGELTSKQKITIDNCYTYAQNSLPMHSYIVQMMQNMLDEMRNIKDEVDDGTIKSEIYKKRIITLESALSVLRSVV